MPVDRDYFEEYYNKFFREYGIERIGNHLLLHIPEYQLLLIAGLDEKGSEGGKREYVVNSVRKRLLRFLLDRDLQTHDLKRTFGEKKRRDKDFLKKRITQISETLVDNAGKFRVITRKVRESEKICAKIRVWAILLHDRFGHEKKALIQGAMDELYQELLTLEPGRYLRKIYSHHEKDFANVPVPDDLKNLYLDLKDLGLVA